jgi:hypothetical protein
MDFSSTWDFDARLAPTGRFLGSENRFGNGGFKSSFGEKGFVGNLGNYINPPRPPGDFFENLKLAGTEARPTDYWRIR